MVGYRLGFPLLYIGSFHFDNIIKETQEIYKTITMLQTTQNFEMNSMQIGIPSFTGKISYDKFSRVDELQRER